MHSMPWNSSFLVAIVPRSAGFSVVRLVTCLYPYFFPTDVIVINIAAIETAQINSPFYPNNYDSNLDVVWTIHAEKGQKILVDFIDYNTEACRDHLRAGNGDDFTDPSTALFYWSGFNLPPRFASTENVMWLRFTTDRFLKRYGFSLVARSVSSTVPWVRAVSIDTTSAFYLCCSFEVHLTFYTILCELHW